jgi:hypothetical protein
MEAESSLLYYTIDLDELMNHRIEMQLINMELLK